MPNYTLSCNNISVGIFPTLQSAKCYYKNNQLSARCSFWDVKGNLEIRDYYKDKLHGECLKYDLGGVLYEKSVYEKGHYKKFYSAAELHRHKRL